MKEQESPNKDIKKWIETSNWRGREQKNVEIADRRNRSDSGCPTSKSTFERFSHFGTMSDIVLYNKRKRPDMTESKQKKTVLVKSQRTKNRHLISLLMSKDDLTQTVGNSNKQNFEKESEHKSVKSVCVKKDKEPELSKIAGNGAKNES